MRSFVMLPSLVPHMPIICLSRVAAKRTVVSVCATKGVNGVVSAATQQQQQILQETQTVDEKMTLRTKYTPPHMYMLTNTVVLSGSTIVYWFALPFMRYARMPGMRLSDW